MKQLPISKPYWMQALVLLKGLVENPFVIYAHYIIICLTESNMKVVQEAAYQVYWIFPQHNSSVAPCVFRAAMQNLQEENEQLREQRLCSVCLDLEKNVVFLPCAHLCCCDKCAPQLRKCPICRKGIRGSVRVYTP